jgi:DNA-directed RNA polymerase subunit delta
LELNVFAGQEKSELSMIEVARAILEERGRGNEIYFNDLVNEIQNYLEKSNSEIRAALPIFYSDLNVDGSFIPLGDNKWGLRSWYAIDEIDEEVITLEEDVKIFTKSFLGQLYDNERLKIITISKDEKSE